jgi:hypothetical protein
MLVTSTGRTAFPNRQARGALNVKSQRTPIARTLSDRQADEYYRARSKDDQQDPFANLSDGLARVKERRSTTNFPMAGAIESPATLFCPRLSNTRSGSGRTLSMREGSQ